MHYRPEIDGLRALAVVPVLLFHAGFGFVPGGFVGVDVFFVISGFLITSIIHQEIRCGTFSVVSFYERRARRLVPALSVVCAVSVVFALSWMLPRELNSFGKGLYATNLLGSNFQLWDQTGYFAPATGHLPLLHTWSLAVEEQFYIVLPLLLLASRRFPAPVMLNVLTAICVVSFSVTLVLAGIDPEANFYLLPSRFWELGIGAIVALTGLADKSLAASIRENLAALGLFAIVASYLLITETKAYPGWLTLPAVVGTALFLAFARTDTLIGRWVSFRPFVVVGLWSYSLYLWHQPVFAFARLRFNDSLPPAAYLALIALCFLLAFLTWRFVERPFRDHRRIARRPIFVMTLMSGTMLIGMGLLLDKTDGFAAHNIELARINEPSVGIGKHCDGVVDLICATSDQPEIAIWGDSFARHLVDGVMASKSDVRLVQLTKNNCGPFFDMAPILERLGDSWSDKCLEHNESVRRFLLKNKSIKYVVLSSPLLQYVSEKMVLLRETGASASGVRPVVENFQATLSWLRAHGFHPVVIAPPPRDGRNTGLCVARAELLSLPASSCDLPIEAVRHHDRDVRAILGIIAAQFPVLNFDEYLCDRNSCRSVDHEIPIYENDGHFSAQGSRHMGQTLRFYSAFSSAAEHGCGADDLSVPRGNCALTPSHRHIPRPRGNLADPVHAARQ
ncbi:acyltransferase family protein [Ensifer sp. LCM 4579]|uniref:acyltransferase family protein n=1 Tax=Ensifer sp. LCM 4579 TaxID=1848292 RepID=UPI0008D919DC|nr:acyltransferase family protein [Ensifer sp. LCM 4579]OHV77979.1 acyltransferase [Ensifer sp. LCM 4579]